MASEQEIQMIIKVNTKLHYEKRDEVNKIYSFAVQKNIFKGEFGKKYMARLKGILESGQPGTDCVLCGGKLANPQQSLICPACLRKHQTMQVQKKPDETKQTYVRERQTPYEAEQTSGKVQPVQPDRQKVTSMRS